jgi:hypothetical protein
MYSRAIFFNQLRSLIFPVKRVPFWRIKTTSLNGISDRFIEHATLCFYGCDRLSEKSRISGQSQKLIGTEVIGDWFQKIISGD